MSSDGRAGGPPRLAPRTIALADIPAFAEEVRRAMDLGAATRCEGGEGARRAQRLVTLRCIWAPRGVLQAVHSPGHHACTSSGQLAVLCEQRGGDYGGKAEDPGDTERSLRHAVPFHWNLYDSPYLGDVRMALDKEPPAVMQARYSPHC